MRITTEASPRRSETSFRQLGNIRSDNKVTGPISLTAQVAVEINVLVLTIATAGEMLIAMITTSASSTKPHSLERNTSHTDNLSARSTSSSTQRYQTN